MVGWHKIKVPVKFFVIATETRHASVESELKRVGANYLIVEAIPVNSVLVEWFSWHVVPIEDPINETEVGGFKGRPGKSIIASFLSHLKALKLFIDDEENVAAVICEDDVRFLCDINQFWTKIEAALQQTNTSDVVRLSYLDSLHPSPYHESIILSDGTFSGAQMYMLSRNFAKHAVDTLDHPVRLLQNPSLSITSEIHLNKAYMETVVIQPKPRDPHVAFVHPPLAVEDANLTSTIGNSPHWQVFEKYGFQNYSGYGC
eukprot:jgi/Galph1/5880/GphlegSOOS_G4438.1